MRVCARAPVCVVYMCMRVLAWVRAHESVSALMRECACTCVWAYADLCMYKMHKHIKAARVVSKKQHRRQEGDTCRLYIYIYYIYIPFFPLPFLFPLLCHGIIISLYDMNMHIYAYISMNSLIYDSFRLHTETGIVSAHLYSYGT